MSYSSITYHVSLLTVMHTFKKIILCINSTFAKRKGGFYLVERRRLKIIMIQPFNISAAM